MSEYTVPSFLAYTIGILVFFIGIHLNKRVAFLRDYNIPEPVTGGLLAAVVVFSFFYSPVPKLLMN